MLVPLAVLAWWQRVDGARTFSLRWPGTGAGRPWPRSPVRRSWGAGCSSSAPPRSLGRLGHRRVGRVRELSARAGRSRPQRPGLAWPSCCSRCCRRCCEELFFRGWMLAASPASGPRRGRAVAAVVAQAAAVRGCSICSRNGCRRLLLGLALGMDDAGHAEPSAGGRRPRRPQRHAVHARSRWPRRRILPRSRSGRGMPPAWAVAAAASDAWLPERMLLAVAARGRDARNP